MPTQKIDPKVIFASDAPAIDKPPVFSDKTKGWDVARANDGRPEIKQMNKVQQDTDLKILWLNENAVLPYDASIDYPDGAVTIKDGSFKQLSSGSWVEFLDDFADKDAVKRGIANRYDSSLTYNSGERVVLANGDIVKSTVDGNTNDPNVNMTGWVGAGNEYSVNTIADLMSLQNPKNDQVVNVKGYYAPNFALAQPYKGGDLFYYVASLSTVNNGVTVFNGWVRDTSDKLLTTDDAGLLGDGTDSNVTVRLQNLFSAVDDGFTLQINGKYVITTNLFVLDVDSLTITGVAGEIVGDNANWVFGNPLLSDIIPRGLVLASRCNNININNLKIKGVQLNHTASNADPWQDGDCAIHVLFSDHATVEKNDCSNTFAWSILIEQSNFPIVRDNKISDVTHQSGINCSIGQRANNFAVVCNNTIDNVGLYGIEWETYSGSLSMQCYNNTIINCYAGIAVVSNIECYGFISNNNIFGSSIAGIYLRDVTNIKNQLNVTGNHVSHSRRGILVQGSNGINITENKLFGYYDRHTYQKISAESFIVRVDANNKFVMANGGITPFNINVGSVLSVNAKKTVTITAIENISGGLGVDKLITVAETTLTPDDRFKHLHWLIAPSGRGEAGIESEGAQKNILISKNVSTDFFYTYQKQIGDSVDSSFNELVVDNVFSGAPINSIMNLVATKGVYYRGNTVSGGVSRTTREVIEGGYIDLKPLQTNVLNISRAGGATHPTATINVFKGVSIVAVYVRPIGASTTGAMSILINGTPYTHSSVGASARVIACERFIGAGDINIQLSDSVGDLVYSNVEITLLTM